MDKAKLEKFSELLDEIVNKKMVHWEIKRHALTAGGAEGSVGVLKGSPEGNSMMAMLKSSAKDCGERQPRKHVLPGPTWEFSTPGCHAGRGDDCCRAIVSKRRRVDALANFFWPWP